MQGISLAEKEMSGFVLQAIFVFPLYKLANDCDTFTLWPTLPFNHQKIKQTVCMVNNGSREMFCDLVL